MDNSRKTEEPTILGMKRARRDLEQAITDLVNMFYAEWEPQDIDVSVCKSRLIGTTVYETRVDVTI
jgi:hypothetical protein